MSKPEITLGHRGGDFFFSVPISLPIPSWIPAFLMPLDHTKEFLYAVTTTTNRKFTMDTLHSFLGMVSDGEKIFSASLIAYRFYFYGDSQLASQAQALLSKHNEEND